MAAFVGIATVEVSLTVLLHVVLASEILAAIGADGRFFARMLLGVSGRMAGGCEGVTAVVLL